MAKFNNSPKFNSNGEKLYPISITKHQHNMEHAYCMLSNRRYEAQQMGDAAAVARFDARIERCNNYRALLIGCCGVGWFTGEEYADAMKMI